MPYNFPNAPVLDEEFVAGSTSYVWDGEVWRLKPEQPSQEYLPLNGGTMWGPIYLPVPQPTEAEEATHKQYVDESIAAQSLYQGVWQVAANIPDLTPSVANPLHSYSWIAVTTDPVVPETPPDGIPGLSGVLIGSADSIIWNANSSQYEVVRSPAAASGFVPITGGTMTGTLEVQAAEAVKIATVAGVQMMRLACGSGAHSGLIEFFAPDGVTRRGYFGYGDANYLQLQLENGVNQFRLNGGIALGERTVTNPDDVSDHLSFWDSPAYGISVTSGRLNYVIAQTGNSHFFRVAGADKLQVHDTGIAITGNASITGNFTSHVIVNNAGFYATKGNTANEQFTTFTGRTSDNKRCFEIRAYKQGFVGGDNEGGIRVAIGCGGYGFQDLFQGQVGSPPTVYCYGACSATGFTDRGAAATKHDIRDTTPEEVTAAWAALQPKRFRKNNPTVDADGKAIAAQPTPKLRYGFVADDLAANPATRDIADFKWDGSNGPTDEVEGTDIMQVLALTVAKVKQLEAELASLRKK